MIPLTVPVPVPVPAITIAITITIAIAATVQRVVHQQIETMHGQKRNDYKMRARDPVVAEARQSKAQQWFRLSGLLIQKHKNATADTNDTNDNDDNVDDDDDDDDSNEATLALLSKLLLVNPDPMYLWNHRRDLLVRQNQNNNNNNAKNTMDELELTQQCLGRNSKAYSVWFHRKWWIQRIIEISPLEEHTTSKENVLQQELELTTQFLLLDERNFHCWNYRRFIIGLLGNVICGATSPTAAGEWTWLTHLTTQTSISTMTKKPMGRQVGQSSTIVPVHDLNDKISNTEQQLLQALLDSEWDFTTIKINANFSNGSAFHYRSTLLTLQTSADLSQELELIHNAIFTEPDDQTAWWYLEFLLSQGLLSDVMLQTEKELLQELALDERESKWVWLGLYNVVSRMENEQDTMLESLDRLIELDMDRKARYKCLKEIILEKMTKL